MLFHSHAFLLGFLPLTLAGFFLAGRWWGARAALVWVLLASLVFYGWWNWAHVPLLLGSILLNLWLARRLALQTDPARRRCWLIGGIAANLGLLGWFKYAGFLGTALGHDGFGADIVLPLAISFFTFQQIMALTDAAGPADRRHPAPPPDPLAQAGYVAFFPHLIAGPLVRPGEITAQLTHPAFGRPDSANLTAGATIFLLGLCKKLVLADPFGRFADIGFDAAARGEALTAIEAWYALLAYALQIYFDFSGYSDMAIGLARMMNVRFPLNFDSPYQARSIAAFWRCWHITLGQFLRDFVFIPLGGSRSGPWRHALALMTTMLLCGLWHGAAWRFVLWGGLHGLYLLAHATWRRWGRPLPTGLAWLLTLLAVIVAWVPFRAADLATTWAFLTALVGGNGIALPAMIVKAIPGLSSLVQPVSVLPFLGDARTLSFPEVTACLALGWTLVLLPPHIHAWGERARAWALTAGFAFAVQAVFFAPDVPPFLYFQF